MFILYENGVKTFVAFYNYYRRFTKNFSEYSRHLTSLSRKGVSFECTADCDSEFKYLKKTLKSPTLLQYHVFTKEYCKATDSSKHACGAVLTQEYEGKQLPKINHEQDLTAIH